MPNIYAPPDVVTIWYTVAPRGGLADRACSTLGIWRAAGCYSRGRSITSRDIDLSFDNNHCNFGQSGD